MVDLGAGTGQFTLAAAEVCRRVVAVDVSPLMLARLREKLDHGAELMADDVEGGWTRVEIAEHVRDEHSTFTWLLEPMIERAGFDLVDVDYDGSGVLAQYCVGSDHEGGRRSLGGASSKPWPSSPTTPTDGEAGAAGRYRAGVEAVVEHDRRGIDRLRLARGSAPRARRSAHGGRCRQSCEG